MSLRYNLIIAKIARLHYLYILVVFVNQQMNLNFSDLLGLAPLPFEVVQFKPIFAHLCISE